MTAAIILAAGASTRMGTPKAQIPFGGGTFLTHLTRRLREHCHPVIIVLGAHTTGMADAHAVMNANWRKGQLSSLQCGLRALPSGTASALFTLVDHPDPAGTTIAALIASSHPIAIPVFGGRKGHPVLLRAPLFPEILALPPTESLKPLLRAYSSETEYIAVEDPAILDDIDDPEALARFQLRTAGRQA